MPYHIAFAVNADSIDTVSDAIKASTNITREGHENSYPGVYDLFRIPEELMVKYNFVEEENEWDYSDHKDRDVVIVARQTDRPRYIEEIV